MRPIFINIFIILIIVSIIEFVVIIHQKKLLKEKTSSVGNKAQLSGLPPDDKKMEI